MFNKLIKTSTMIVCLLLVFAVSAGYCGTTATFGDKNASGIHRMEASFDGTNGTIKFAADTAILFPYQSGTTNDTLVAADSGRTYVVTGSTITSEPVLTLPAAAVGMVFPIISGTTYAVYINPNGTDTINYASLSAGDSISNTTTSAKGDAITFFCVTANAWEVQIISGTWADEDGFGD